jgi:adenine deaminase
MQDLNAPGLRDRAVRAARGQDAFDVLITGGTLVDVATSELRAADIGLVGPLDGVAEGSSRCGS